MAYQRTRFDDLVIDEAITAVPADFDAADLLARAAAERWPNGEWLDDAARAYLARVRSCARQCPNSRCPRSIPRRWLTW